MYSTRNLIYYHNILVRERSFVYAEECLLFISPLQHFYNEHRARSICDKVNQTDHLTRY